MTDALLGKSDDPFIAVVLALVVGGVIVVFVAVSAYTKVREWLSPSTVVGRVRQFVGRELRGKLEVHEKSFPGYDLASVNRALTDLFAARCAGGSAEPLGSFEPTALRELLERDSTDASPYYSKTKVSAPSYVRLPVDVDDDASFVSCCLYLCRLTRKPADAAGTGGRDDAGGDERVVVLLASQVGQPDYGDDVNGRQSPAAAVKVTVGCRTRAVADRFFTELDERRKALSIYRGKVIDPVVNDGGVHSVAFRRIHAVRERDLILPESVTALLRGSIVNFYQNHTVLRSLGVELKRGILFHSPPGTGKTSISLYLAGLLPNFTVCFISGRRLLYPREVCAMARYLQPAMLVFEDIDLIAQERDQNGLATVLGELMNQIDGCEPNEQVLFIMNTNSMSRIEDAVRNRPGRVDQIIHIPLPNLAERQALVRHFGRDLALDDAVVLRTAEATDGATPALLKEVVKRAAVMAVTRSSGDRHGVMNVAPGSGGGSGNGDAVGRITVSEGDLLLAVQQVQYQREQATALDSRLRDQVL